MGGCRVDHEGQEHGEHDAYAQAEEEVADAEKPRHAVLGQQDGDAQAQKRKQVQAPELLMQRQIAVKKRLPAAHHQHAGDEALQAQTGGIGGNALRLDAVADGPKVLPPLNKPRKHARCHAPHDGGHAGKGEVALGLHCGIGSLRIVM